jgi:hypothetical protein
MSNLFKIMIIIILSGNSYKPHTERSMLINLCTMKEKKMMEKMMDDRMMNMMMEKMMKEKMMDRMMERM